MLKQLATLLIFGFALIGGAPAAPADAAGAEATGNSYQDASLTVEDTAGVLDLDALVPALDEISFHEPTRVAIYTRNGEKGENLNEEVLRFARSAHPEWISPDGQKWADGLFIFALDPAGRQVGTYFGEDRDVSPGQRDDIQDAAKPLLREAQWTDATATAVESAASLMNRPWYLNPALAIGGIVALIGAAGAVFATYYARSRTRKRSLAALAAGDTAFANVSLDLQATELNARTIPDASSYGHLVLEQYRGFTTSYRELAAMNAEVHALSPKELKKKKNADACERYAAAATSLDALDDVIADTNELLNLYSGWASAWDRQTAPFAADLDGLDALFADKQSATQDASVAALTSFRTTARADLMHWAAGIDAGTLSPERALDLLAAARGRLAQLLDFHANAVIDHYAKTTDEAQLMRESMRGGSKGSYGHGTRYGSSSNDILYAVNPPLTYISVAAFSHNLHHGQETVDGSRSSDSSGGSTGYGSSGGSFSGSGSSSSF